MNISTFFASSFVAAVVTFLLTVFDKWQRNARESRALLRGILLEIDRAEACATDYLRDSMREGKIWPWAPAYRVPTEFLREGILKLSVNGDLTESEVQYLHKLYVLSGEANRCLELLEMLNGKLPGPDSPELPHAWKQMGLETDRCRVKFTGVGAAIESARSAAVAALSRLAWFEAS